MTAPVPAADQQFRSALESVQTYPLEKGRRPAFALPPAAPRRPRVTGGAVSGPDGDIWSTLASLRAGRLSVRDLIRGCLERIEAHSDRLVAFEFVANVQEYALRLDNETASGTTRGPLHGIPISVKDIIDVKGMPTTGSSRALPPHVAGHDATAVKHLRDAGAVLIGKTVTHEFALGVTTPQSRNPWDETRVPGGSSGGSAIAVATRMSLGSLGSDTRASIRVPAALSGVVGFRPTTGLVPIDSWLTLSWSLDVLAPLARSVRDIALLIDVLTASGSRFRDALPGSISGLKIGYSDAFGAGREAGVDERFEASLEAARKAGAEVVQCHALTEEDVQLANYAGMIISRVEAAQFHSDAGTDLAMCTPEVRTQLSQAGEVAAVDYVRCLRIREKLHERFLGAFSGIDLLIMPTSGVVAPAVEEAAKYLLVLSETCIPWSLVGFPAISLFSGMSDGLPTGVQLVAPSSQDAFLLAAAHALERELPPIPEWPE